MLKINGNGDSLWQRSFPDQGYETVDHIFGLKDLSTIIAITDRKFVKINDLGEIIWTKQIGTSLNDTRYYGSSMEMPDQSILSCGTSGGLHEKSRFSFLKTSYEGAAVDERDLNNPDTLSDFIHTKVAAVLNPDLSVTIAGTTKPNIDITCNLVIFSVDEAGKLLWKYVDDKSNPEENVALYKISSEEYIVVGASVVHPASQGTYYQTFLISFSVQPKE